MTPKKLKRYGTISFFVVFLLLSTAILVPVSSKEAVENKTERNYDMNIIPKLGKMDPLSTAMWGCFNNQQFKSEFNAIKIRIETAVENYINEHPEADKEKFEIFLHLLETFVERNVEKRLNSIDVDNYLQDVQKLLRVSDNENSFVEKVSNIDALETLISSNLLTDEILNGAKGNPEYDNKPDPKSSGLRPFADMVTEIISVIYTVVGSILFLLLGTLGAAFAAVVTIIFFAPIIYYLTMFEACFDAIEYEPKLREELKDIFKATGLIGLITTGPPWILKIAWQEKYVNQAYQNILENLLVWQIELEGTTVVSYKTSEYAPGGANSDEDITTEVDKTENFPFIAWDDDMLNDYITYRDSIQFGIDWNGDHVVDEWSHFVTEKNDITKCFMAYHSWNKEGKYDVSFVPRDQWGVRGEWTKSITVTVEKDDGGSKAMPLFNRFPLLSLLLNRLLFDR